jgi:unsaturated pyranuronate lyase
MKHMRHHKLGEIPEEHVTDLLSRKFFTGEKITVAFFRAKKGCVVPSHHHESEQFSYCISGALKFKIGDQDLVLQAGELLEIPPNLPHQAEVIEDFIGIDIFSPIRIDWLKGSDDYLRQKV